MKRSNVTEPWRMPGDTIGVRQTDTASGREAAGCGSRHDVTIRRLITPGAVGQVARPFTTDAYEGPHSDAREQPMIFCITCVYMLRSSLAYSGPGAVVGVGVLLAGVPLLFLARCHYQ
jgi:hypothetical protein